MGLNPFEAIPWLSHEAKRCGMYANQSKKTNDVYHKLIDRYTWMVEQCYDVVWS